MIKIKEIKDGKQLKLYNESDKYTPISIRTSSYLNHESDFVYNERNDSFGFYVFFRHTNSNFYEFAFYENSHEFKDLTVLIYSATHIPQELSIKNKIIGNPIFEVDEDKILNSNNDKYPPSAEFETPISLGFGEDFIEIAFGEIEKANTEITYDYLSFLAKDNILLGVRVKNLSKEFINEVILMDTRKQNLVSDIYVSSESYANHVLSAEYPDKSHNKLEAIVKVTNDFINGEMSALDFEKIYIDVHKNHTGLYKEVKIDGEISEIFFSLFFEVDAFCSVPEWFDKETDITAEQLLDAAKTAMAKYEAYIAYKNSKNIGKYFSLENQYLKRSLIRQIYKIKFIFYPIFVVLFVQVIIYFVKILLTIITLGNETLSPVINFLVYPVIFTYSLHEIFSHFKVKYVCNSIIIKFICAFIWGLFGYIYSFIEIETFSRIHFAALFTANFVCYLFATKNNDEKSISKVYTAFYFMNIGFLIANKINFLSIYSWGVLILSILFLALELKYIKQKEIE